MIKRKISGFFKRYIYLVNLEKENEVLKKRLHLYEDISNRYFWLLEENRRLREILSLRDRWEGIVGARIVGGSYFSNGGEVYISAGGREGIKEGDVVITVKGLLGRVVSVGSRFSKVITVYSPEFSCGVEIVPRRVDALFRGGEEGLLEFVYENEEVYPGDLVFTSGIDGKFPAGIPLGIVASVEKGKYFKKVLVVPFSTVKNERIVGVITK